MNTWRVIQNIGLVTLIGISLTCDSNTKNLSSTIKNQKSDIENIFTPPIDSNIIKPWTTKYISDITSPQIIDILEQWDISTQQDINNKDSINTDTIQVMNMNSSTHSKIIDTTGKWANEININISNNNITKTISQEECDIIMQSQLKKAVEEIVVQTDKLNFDLEYMRGEVSSLLEDFFLIQYTDDWLELKFLWVKDTDHKNIMNHMDNIRSHIKSNNWILVKIFLSKSKLREYTTENIPVVYKILSKNNSIEYEWWEHQFTKDINSIINIYK